MRETEPNSFPNMVKDLYAEATSDESIEALRKIGLHMYVMSRWTLASVLHPASSFKAVMLMGDQETIDRNAEYALTLPKVPDKVTNVLSEIHNEFTLANGISALRPALVIAANAISLDKPLEYTTMMTAAFATDVLDGMVARRQKKSKWGGFVDIAADRSAEALMYLYLSGKGVIPGWVPAVTIGRGVVTDIIRASHILLDKSVRTEVNVLSPGKQNGNDIATSRTVRTVYGAVKASVAISAPFLPSASELLSEIATGICVIRGVPVVFNRENAKLFSVLKNMGQNQK